MIAGSGGPAPNRVCEVARIDIPIIQAPMTYIAGAQLAAGCVQRRCAGDHRDYL
jgi:enoyl-[acyl-carrier protein] reductase II